MIATDEQFFNIVLKHDFVSSLGTVLNINNTTIQSKTLDFIFDLTDIDSETLKDDSIVDKIVSELVI